MDNLRTKEIEGKEFERQFDKATKGYLALRVRDLFPGTVLPFEILFPTLNMSTKSIVLKSLLEEGGTFDGSLQDWLLREEIEDVYLRKERENQLLQYFNENVKRIIHSDEVTSERKTMLLYDSAESIISKVFREKPSQENLNLGTQLIENLAVHLAMDSVNSDALLSVFSKDYYTFSHCVQVAMLGMAFCNHLGWSKQETIDFGIGALFHDVGKSHIDDEILNKPSRLTNEEFEIIKKHSLLGYQQLKNTQTMSRSQLSVPLSHHEAMDGTGYPQGLKAEAIHKYARVARIVDVYDALSTRRAYKDALPIPKVLEIMGGEMGPTFDKRLLQSFVSFLGADRSMPKPDQGKRLNLELGNEVHITLTDVDLEMKLTVIGMEVDSVLILRVPGRVDLQEYAQVGKEVTARYTFSGTPYQFKATVLGHMAQPVPFILLSYPQNIEKQDKRGAQRFDCLTRVTVTVRNVLLHGVILNVSSSGCRLVLKLPGGEKLPEMSVGEAVHLQSLGQEKRPPMAGAVKNLFITSGKVFLGVQFQGVSEEDMTAFLQSLDGADK